VVDNLANFTALTDLILDKNKMTVKTLSSFPLLSSVETLWLNNNELEDLPRIMDALAAKVSAADDDDGSPPAHLL